MTLILKHKKIALLLFGHLRTYKRTFPLLAQNLLKYYDVDIFITTWENNEHSKKTHHLNKMKVEKITNTEWDSINNLYNPKDIRILKETETFNITEAIASNWILTLFWQQYNCRKLVFDLMENYKSSNNINYDAVIITRPDVSFNGRFIIPEELSDEEFFVCGNLVRGQFSQNHHAFQATDVIHVSNSNVAKESAEILSSFDKWFTNILYSGVNFAKGDIHFGTIPYLISKGITPKYLNYNFYEANDVNPPNNSWSIIRHNSRLYKVDEK
jgi:hypothetical protein